MTLSASQRLRRILTAGVACLALSGVRAQQETTVLRVKSRLVEVAATVYDNKGRYVDDLTRERIHILEDGQPQTIKDFESSAQPMHCAILLDTTGSMDGALPSLKNSVARFIDQLGPADSVAVYTFAEQLVIQQDWTTDKDAAKRSILRLRAHGGTALFDALSETAREVGTQSGRKAIVVFTDGDDNASVLNSTNAVNRARKNGIPLFTIAEGEALQSSKLKKILADLSDNTGGAAFAVKNFKEMSEVFEVVSGDLRHMYLINYSPHQSPDDRWRKIEVEVDGVKGYKVRAREGYLPN